MGVLPVSQFQLPASHQPGVEDPFKSLPVGDVRVSGLLGDRMQSVWKGNILSLKVDRDCLQPFLNKDGKTVPDGFVGLGTFTDSLVRFAKYTGDSSLMALKNHVIDTTIRSQDADGYIGFNPPAKRIREAWDIHELNYIVYGLTTNYLLFNHQPSLTAARKAADYMVQGLSGKLPGAVDDSNIYLGLVVTGFDRTMLRLYQVTADKRYLDILDDVGLKTWNLDIVQGRTPPYYGHMYAYLARSLAQLELFHLTGDLRLLAQTDKAIDFLRNSHGLLVSGSGNKIECWYSDQSGAGQITESCATAYLVRTLDQLNRMRADARYGDMMERAIYNSLFAAISPDGRNLRYWTPVQGQREYYPKDFMCCPCNLRRIVSELPSMIYYQHAAGGIIVNLYTASTADFDLRSAGRVHLEQTTDYPNSGHIGIDVTVSKKGAVFPLILRIPHWCKKATLSVNEKPIPVSGSGYTEVRREWRQGDRIELNLDMPWRLLRGAQTQSGKVAVLRGPMLYCLNPALNRNVADLDLGHLTLDPESFSPPRQDNNLRANGTACVVNAWSSGIRQGPTDVRLVLTEFLDPGGQAVYFRAPAGANIEQEELLNV